jgi:hypothetical protein
MAQMIECLPSKNKDPSSNFQTAKKETNNKKYYFQKKKKYYFLLKELGRARHGGAYL